VEALYQEYATAQERAMVLLRDGARGVRIDKHGTGWVLSWLTCAECGEPWPCTVQSNRGAYLPAIVARHTVRS
jgi:hypothetical protein